MLKVIQLFTVLFGVFCVTLSVILSIRFSRVKTKLSKALAMQLFVEGFIGCFTVFFAVTSYLGFYKELEPWLVVLIRVSIFGSAALTSLHLFFTVNELERGE